MGEEEGVGTRTVARHVQEVQIDVVEPGLYCGKPLSLASWARQSK
jgi:hypothetical protein